MSSGEIYFRACEAGCFCLGLLVGLGFAANIWVVRYVLGYRAGIKMCMEAIEPLWAELAAVVGVMPVHKVTEEVRLKLKAELGRETRH